MGFTTFDCSASVLELCSEATSVFTIVMLGTVFGASSFDLGAAGLSVTCLGVCDTTGVTIIGILPPPDGGGLIEILIGGVT